MAFGGATRASTGSGGLFTVHVEKIGDEVMYVVVGPTGAALYSFGDRRQAQAEAAVLNEPQSLAARVFRF